jgi:uncharacterized membrane protein
MENVKIIFAPVTQVIVVMIAIVKSALIIVLVMVAVRISNACVRLNGKVQIARLKNVKGNV